jgi:cytochrome P450
MRAAARGDGAPPDDSLLAHINAAQAAMGLLFITPLPALRALLEAREPGMASLQRALEGMHTQVAPIIAARRAQLAAASAARAADAAAPPPRDLLDALLGAQDAQGLSDREVWEHVHDVLGAGHDTTATAVAAALHALQTRTSPRSLTRSWRRWRSAR